MFALQGPLSRRIMAEVVQAGKLPEPFKNAVDIGGDCREPCDGRAYRLSGEPLVSNFSWTAKGPMLWDLLVSKGAAPIGLAARDTWPRIRPAALRT